MAKGKHKKGGGNLGRSIIRQQFAPTLTADDAQLLETERGKHKLRSVTQCDDLEELMSNAVLAGTDFAAKRGEVILLGQEVRSTPAHGPGLEAASAAPSEVPIPRRPAWQAQQTAAELDRNEGAQFVEWRARMAAIEEGGCLLTPFEKNLEVWRQLWRVLERSQLIVQIVDARNPLLFRSADLERYAAEIDPSKRCMLLVNKADLLTEAQRGAWAKYFRAHGIDFVFWSAVKAQAALEEEVRQERHQASRRQARDMVAAASGVQLSDGAAAAAAATTTTTTTTTTTMTRRARSPCWLAPPGRGRRRRRQSRLQHRRMPRRGRALAATTRPKVTTTTTTTTRTAAARTAAAMRLPTTPTRGLACRASWRRAATAARRRRVGAAWRATSRCSRATSSSRC